jgi:hypothetical protein
MILEGLNRNDSSHTEFNDTEISTFSAAFTIVAIDTDVTRKAGSYLSLSSFHPCGVKEVSTFVATNFLGTTAPIRFPISDFRHF